MVPAVPLALEREANRRRGPRAYFANIWRTANSILEGLSVTMSWMFRRPATIQYPDKIEKPVQEMLPDGYRGILEVDLARCVACMLCMRTCPIGCIEIGVEKNAETGAREITRFDIDMGRCMYCGLCAEACAYDSIVHTTQFEACMPHPDLLVLHFAKTPAPVAKHKPGEGPPRRPRGSILPEVMAPFGGRSGERIWRGRRVVEPRPDPSPEPGEERSDG